MNKFFSFFIFHFSFFIFHCNAQEYKRGNEWITGGGGQRIQFTTNGIVTNDNYFINSYFIAGHSCVSDTNGNLLLASDGYNLYDKWGGGVLDGDSLIPNDYYVYQYGFANGSQGSIILPMDSNKFYLVVPTFSDSQFADCLQNNNCYFDLLLYNVIDMNANGGAGQVVQRMVPLLQNANLRKTQMQACRHGNGKDWWLLKNEGDNADVHTFLFTQNSVYDMGVQTFAQPNWGTWDIRGQSTFNADGTMFVTATHCSSCGTIFIADFDRCWGILRNPKTIQMPWGSMYDPVDTAKKERLTVGLSFSPNGQYLYVASRSNIYQYDLQDSSWFHVAGLDTTFLHFSDYETAYNAPDGKIYIGNRSNQSRQMSRIDNPDVKGAGCNFCPRCLRLDSLGTNANAGTPPCMPNYGLGARECYPLPISQYANEQISQLELFPNPTNTILNVELKILNFENLNFEIQLFNSVGQLVFNSKFKIQNYKLQIDVSNYAKGIYYLKCSNHVKKVIIE